MAKEYCSIYVIRNTVNEKVYVGQTWNDPEKRLARHVKENGCPKINRAVQKYGAHNFYVEELLGVTNQIDADYFEIEFIRKFDSIENGYNLTLGGLGGKHSEETKNKMSKMRKGRKFSPEICQKFSESKMGEKNPMFGTKHTEEHKAKIAYSMKGKKNNPNTIYPGHTNQTGSKHAQAKLKESDIIQIRRLLKSGITQPAVAKLFGVSRSCILAINLRRTWKHVPEE